MTVHAKKAMGRSLTYEKSMEAQKQRKYFNLFALHGSVR